MQTSGPPVSAALNSRQVEPNDAEKLIKLCKSTIELRVKIGLFSHQRTGFFPPVLNSQY